MLWGERLHPIICGRVTHQLYALHVLITICDQEWYCGQYNPKYQGQPNLNTVVGSFEFSNLKRYSDKYLKVTGFS